MLDISSLLEPIHYLYFIESDYILSMNIYGNLVLEEHNILVSEYYKNAGL